MVFLELPASIQTRDSFTRAEQAREPAFCGARYWRRIAGLFAGGSCSRCLHLESRRLWTFAFGLAFGALVCVILVWWLTTSEQPRAEQFVPGPEPVSVRQRRSPFVSEMPSWPNGRSPLRSARLEGPESSRRRVPRPIRRKDLSSARCGSTLRHKARARVFIDRPGGRRHSTRRLDLGAGSHAIRIEADGYLPWPWRSLIADRRTA